MKVDVKPLVSLCFALLIAACGTTRNRLAEEAPDQTRASERELPLPALPKQENLLEFYVSGATSNHFFIDPLSLNVDKDGIVRYTMVVKTSGGATNISFEGIRCGTAQLRLYAIGRNDGTWSRARISEWREIEDKPVNRHQAALHHNYFCPGNMPLTNAAEGVEALRRGGHPEAR